MAKRPIVHASDGSKQEVANADSLYVNVKWSPYSAVGNGVNDDTAEIQAAIDAVIAAGGGTVAIPSGEYIISSTLDLGSDVTLIGVGENSLINCGSLNDAIIEASDASRIVIKDIKILGNADYANNTSQQGINLINCSDCTIDNVTAENVSRNGIRVAGKDNDSGVSEHNVVTNNRCVSCDSGIWLYAGASHNTVHGNTIRSSNRYGIVLDDGTTGESTPRQSNENSITGNTIDSCGYSGIHNESSSYNAIVGNNVQNCGTTSGYVLGGIVIDNAQLGNKSIGNVVVANVVTNSGDHGIEVVGSSRNLIQANLIEDYSKRSANTTGHGIRIRSITYDPGGGSTVYHSDHNVIKNNYVWQTTTGNAGDRTIALEDANVRYTVVSENYVRNENLTVLQWLTDSSTSAYIGENTLANTAAEAVTAYFDILDFYLANATDFFLRSNVAGGDANPRFRIRMDGRLEWGDGTNATDTTLYRSATSVLTTEDLIRVLMGAAGSAAYAALVSGDAYSRYIAYADGKLEWGPGNASRDVNLYRSAANTLKTDDQIQAVDGVVTKVNAGAVSDATFTVDTDGLLAIDSSNGRLYFRYGSGWHYCSQDAGFQIRHDERQCAVCGSTIEVGQPVVGLSDEVMSDGALHASYVHLKCVR